MIPYEMRLRNKNGRRHNEQSIFDIHKQPVSSYANIHPTRIRALLSYVKDFCTPYGLHGRMFARDSGLLSHPVFMIKFFDAELEEIK